MESKFEKFLEEYPSRNKGKRSDVLSKKFFSCVIQELIGDEGTVTQPPPLPLNLGPHGEVKFRFDVVVEVNKNITLIEIKKNIDLIDKDLFKFMLSYYNKLSYKNVPCRRVELIWEDRNEIGNGHYKKLLDYAKSQKWIHEWFYIHHRDFQNPMMRLKAFLLS